MILFKAVYCNEPFRLCQAVDLETWKNIIYLPTLPLIKKRYYRMAANI